MNSANGFLMRYVEADRDRKSRERLLLCKLCGTSTRWRRSAGRDEGELELFTYLLARRQPRRGCFRDIDTRNGEMWGKFRATTSRSAVIPVRMRLSRSWEEADGTPRDVSNRP